MTSPSTSGPAPIGDMSGLAQPASAGKVDAGVITINGQNYKVSITGVSGNLSPDLLLRVQEFALETMSQPTVDQTKIHGTKINARQVLQPDSDPILHGKGAEFESIMQAINGAVPPSDPFAPAGPSPAPTPPLAAAPAQPSTPRQSVEAEATLTAEAVAAHPGVLSSDAFILEEVEGAPPFSATVGGDGTSMPPLSVPPVLLGAGEAEISDDSSVLLEIDLETPVAKKAEAPPKPPAEQLIDYGRERMGAIRQNRIALPAQVGAPLELSGDLLKTKKSEKIKHEVLNEAVRESVNNGKTVDAETLNIGGVVSRPVDLTGGAPIEHGKVCPTAMRDSPDMDQANHLFNTYLTVDQQSGAVRIRMSAVDTPQKRAELKALIISARQQGEIPQDFRLVSTQLNSQESEEGLIDIQHAQIAQLGFELQDELDLDYNPVIHLNFPSNGFVHMTRKVPGASWVLKGEAKSHTLNQEGMAGLFSWLIRDAQMLIPTGEELWDLSKLSTEAQENARLSGMDNVLGDLTGVFRDLEAVQRELAACFASVADIPRDGLKPTKAEKAELKKAKSDAADIREHMEHYLNVMRGALEMLKGRLEGLPKSPAAVKQIQSVTLFTTLLDAQMGDIQLDRGQELLLWELLEESMGLVGTANCKSGLDRTGFASALLMAALQMQKEGNGQCTFEDLLDLVLNWEEYYAELDSLVSEEGDVTIALSGKLAMVAQLRNLVLRNLVEMGMGITAQSTGLAGLKWHDGFFNRNRVPLPFLPTFIMVDNKPVRIVQRGSGLSGLRLTEEGKKLLGIDDAEQRGG